MNWWRVLRVAFLVGCLALGIFAPEAWIAGAVIRGLLVTLATRGLSVEHQMLSDEQRFEQQRSLREMDEKQHQRDMQMLLQELEDFWIDAIAPADGV